jgi:hypothetical protein
MSVAHRERLCARICTRPSDALDTTARLRGPAVLRAGNERWRNDIEKFVSNLPRNRSLPSLLGAEPTGLEPTSREKPKGGSIPLGDTN